VLVGGNPDTTILICRLNLSIHLHSFTLAQEFSEGNAKLKEGYR
jgi:hypothetical protein